MKNYIGPGHVFLWNNTKYLCLGYVCGDNCKMDQILLFNYYTKHFESKDPNIENFQFDILGRVDRSYVSEVVHELVDLIDKGFNM